MDEWTERAREHAVRRVERRKFLKGMLGVSGLALMQGSGLAKALLPKQSPSLPAPGASGLETIVVGMMENRSFDHMLGWLGPALGGVQDFSNPMGLAGGDACPTPGPLSVDDATEVKTFHLQEHCQYPDLDHGWDGGRVELNRGQLNGFVERSGPHAMGYFQPEDIPFTSWLVNNYTTFSAYHCSVMGPTYPNREYLHSAQAGGVKDNAIPTPTPSNPKPTGYTWPTIWDRLSAAGVNWVFYGSDLPTIALFFHEIYQHPGRVRHITDYFIDAALGVLPQVAFIDPSFIVVGNDDHPARDIKLGQRFIMDTFLALAQGPQWHSSAYVLTYDEWGGFYDHVAPPTVPDLLADSDHCEDWGQLGFRVPTILASPFAKKGFVGTDLYDHTSILKMIEWRFGLKPLTPRDAAANNLADVLDFSQTPRVDFDSAPPFIPIHEAGLWCTNNQTLARSGGSNPLEPVPDIPVPPLARPAALRDVGASSPSEPHAELRALADAGFFGKLDFRERARAGVWRD